MQACSDIRAQVDADALLQGEINLALLAVADTLPSGPDPRMVRILSRILAVSWTEHMSFQDEVIFPILIGRRQTAAAELIASSRSDHANLVGLHAEIGQQFEGLLAPDHTVVVGLETLLRLTHAKRQAHLATDALLSQSMPSPFTPAECALCEQWTRARMRLRFPLDLVRGGRPYPQLGSRLH
jgi:hypothetical protein